MRSRKVQTAIVLALVAAGIVAVIVLLTRRPVEGPYALRSWTYGGIAWVEPLPEEGLARASTTASRLFEESFELWGFSPPEVAQGRRVARKGDPADGRSVDLRALRWEGALLPPIMVVLFPDAEALAEATGTQADPVILTYGVPPQPGFVDEGTMPVEVAEWLAQLTGASIAFGCSVERWEERFVEAAAVWLLDRALEIPQICACRPYNLPQLVRMGIGGFTVGRLLGGVDRVAVARAYAASHEFLTVADAAPLAFDVDAGTHRALGTSFIAYLVEEHGTDGLIDAICDWYVERSGGYCGMSGSRTLVHLKGWRAFLGLSPE